LRKIKTLERQAAKAMDKKPTVDKAPVKRKPGRPPKKV
jgi:hypothetical protein